MPGAVFARNGVVSLRTPEPEDATFLHRNRSRPEIRRPLRLTDVESHAAIERRIASWSASDDAVLLVCRENEREPADPVGVVTLSPTDEIARTASVTYWTAPDSQENNFASRGLAMLLDHAFADRGLHKVHARVPAPLDGSARVAEKLGFEAEGTLRDEAYLHGEHVDVQWFGLLADEWLD